MAKRAVSIVLIVLRILFGVAFAAAAFMKLSSQPQMVAEFDTVGFGQWFRYFTGIVELLGALLLIRAKTVVFGAGLLTCVSVGAFFAQVFKLHMDVIHTIIFTAAMAWITYSYRSGASVAAS